MVQLSECQRILARLHSFRDEMVSLLKQLAALESPSQDAAAQQPLKALLSDLLRELGFRCRNYRGTSSGGQLLAILDPPHSSAGRQLLLGHCDTVWPLGTLREMPIEMRGGCLHGPGVYDMKAGLVQALFALRVLHDLGIQPQVPPLFFINSDEEIGSPESSLKIQRLAKAVDRAFVLEPSLGIEGKLKTTRKGVGKFSVEVVGRAAHAGLDPEKGVSAIHELSYVIQRLFALGDPERGTTVNVGTIAGGSQPNVIAAHASARIDVRVASEQEAARVGQAIRQLPSTLEGTSLRVEGAITRPPLQATQRNRKLWERACDAAQCLGLSIAEGHAGGGSDGNLTSPFTATLDGLGAVGDGAHALSEHVVVEAMPERAALLAVLLLTEPLESPEPSSTGADGAATG